MSDVYADSTVAITVYNVLCKVTGDVENPKNILDVIRERAHPDLSLNQLSRVFEDMLERGILVCRNNKYSPCDQKKRVVVGRNRDDHSEDIDGRISGGWTNWMVLDVTMGHVPFVVSPPKSKSEVPK